MSGGSPEPTALIDEVEVLVVGAGPAGSSCAGRLAEHGHDVLLVDRDTFPRHKPCGDGLTDASVRVLEEMGLHDLLLNSLEVGGIRTFFDRKPKLRQLERSARCISRSRLDQGILAAAVGRGARFEQLRVDGPLLEDGTVAGVVSAGVGVRARCVIAADGATSRLRRACGFLPPPSYQRAFAVRQYVRTEKPLAPYFDLSPLIHRGAELLGYGWVFPLAEHTANVGVGYYRSHALADPPSLNTVLDEFIAELESGGSGRYGALTRSGRPLGSPLAIDFNPGSCQFQRVLFAGDAAQMTEPVTGEGIGNALDGGAIVAEVAHAALIGTRGPHWYEGLDLGRELDRRFLRIGGDVGLFKRAVARRIAAAGGRPVMRRTDPRREPFFSATAHAIAEPYELPSLQHTAVYALLKESDPQVAAGLDALNERALDEFLTRFPFTPEALHSRLRKDPGPVAAALVLVTACASGRPADQATVAAALGVELLGMFPAFLRQTVDRPAGEGSKVNNIFAILAADLIVSRALGAGAVAGASVARGIAATSCSICEAEMIELADLGRMRTPAQRYLRATELREGALFQLAGAIGGGLAGSSAPASAVARFGRELGVAHRLATDVCDRLADDARSREEAERSFGGGDFVLTDEDALAECEDRAQRAVAALPAAAPEGAVAALAEFPVERIRAALAVR